jgi:hypothetical protein
MWYVVIVTGREPSLLPLVNADMSLSGRVVHCRNCCFHCATATAELQTINVVFFKVAAAVTPTSVLPAPHGNTMMPLLAWPPAKNFERQRS